MKQFVVILDGPMGAGKSTLGELIAPKLKRTALINEDKIKWFISDFKRGKRDNAIVRAVLIAMCKEYLRQGINLVIAQGFSQDRRPLPPFVSMAKKNKSALLMYHLDAPREVLLKRIKERKQFSSVRTPIAKTRIDRNIRSWKKSRYSIGKDFRTDQMSLQKMGSEIMRDIKAL